MVAAIAGCSASGGDTGAQGGAGATGGGAGSGAGAVGGGGSSGSGGVSGTGGTGATSSGGTAGDASLPPVACDGIVAAGHQLCTSTPDTCELVFDDSSGCAAACATAGLDCDVLRRLRANG